MPTTFVAMGDRPVELPTGGFLTPGDRITIHDDKLAQDPMFEVHEQENRLLRLVEVAAPAPTVEPAPEVIAPAPKRKARKSNEGGES